MSSQAAVQVERGVATLRLPVQSGPLAAQVLALSSVVQSARSTANNLPVAILLLSGTFSHLEGEDRVADAGDAAALNSLLEEIGRLAEVTIALVEGHLGIVGTCLLSACDFVFALHTSNFVVTTRDVLGTPSVPLCLLRRIDGADVAHAPRGIIDAQCAAALGLVSEVVQADTTAQRYALLRNELSDPSTHVATLKWLMRRSRTEPVHQRCSKRKMAQWATTLPNKRLACQTAASKKCNAILAALGSNDQPSDHLLSTLVSEALLASSDERGEFHKRTAVLLREALARVESGLAAQAEEGEALLLSAESERILREASLAEAETKVVESQRALLEAKDAVATATASLKEATSEVATIQTSLETKNQGISSDTALRQKIEAATLEWFQPLMEGTSTHSKRHAASLVLLGRKLNLDSTLLNGLPGALATPKEQRNTFDMLILDTFDSEMKKQVARLNETMAEAQTAREALETALRAAEESRCAAKEAQRLSVNRLAEARAAAEEGRLAVRARRAAVSAFGPAVQRVEEETEAARERIATFEAGPLAAFVDLWERPGDTSEGASLKESPPDDLPSVHVKTETAPASGA